MVVLPKKLKYKQEIFGAIIDAFSENNSDEIHYMEIWRKVKEVLKKRVSFRDFQNHIKCMESITSVYHITVPGFTLNEFISYLEKLEKGKEPKPFPYNPSIEIGFF